MIRLAFAGLLAALVFTSASVAAKEDKNDAKKKPVGPLIGHMVYFKLKESTPESKQKLVDACKKYLADHEGVVFFSAGILADSFKREVNDRDWDVALHLVFADKNAHDKYQDHPEHLKFIEENKATWAKVRVFDSEFEGFKTGKKDKKKDAK
ncbi:MAG: Dabb family protein [Gemmataceae bacterium]